MHRRLIKILFLTLIFTALAVVVVRLLKIERHVISGPKTVIELITDSGLKSSNGRVNVLLLGTGGAGHEGPDLTDTMIISSIDKKGKDTVLISIPRDLWTPSLQYKINHAYAFGQEKDKQGLKLARETISTLFDLPIHYAVRVDFGAFVRAVDLVGGLNINVQTPFTDTRYPLSGKEDDLCGLTLETIEVDGIRQEVVKDATGSAIPLTSINDENNPFTCRYETIIFKVGPTKMDGTTALKFVRSRYGTNGEGSDFARSARQQKIILAFREKVFSLGTFFDPPLAIDLINTFDQSIDTDIQNDDIVHFIKLSQEIDPQKLRHLVLDSARPESVLEIGNPAAYGGQFVLVPKGSNWHDLAEYVQGEIFKLEEKN